MYVAHNVHFSVDGHLGGMYVCTGPNRAAVKIQVARVSNYDYIGMQGQEWDSRITYGCLFSYITGSSIPFCIVAAPVDIPSKCVGRIPLHTSSAALIPCRCFWRWPV